MKLTTRAILNFWANDSIRWKLRTSCYMDVIVCICVLRILKYLYLFYIFWKYFSLFFFFSLSLGYHYIIFWCRLVCSNGTFSFRYILRYHQSCYKRQNCSSTICFWLFFDFFFNFMFSLYFFDSWRYWGKLRTKEELLY